MIYILENEKLKIKVSSMGAELQSIYRAETDTEYLWQGDPDFWSGRACNIFPVCGRMIEGKYTYAGGTYDMPIHGFARNMEWEVIHQKSNALTLQLQSNAETLAMFPWNFSLEMVYTLEEDTLSVATILHNLDEKTMLFAIGGHPGFNVPLTDGEKFDDYYVEFDEVCEPRLLVLSDTCYYTGNTAPYPLEEGKRIPLHHRLFDNDALFFCNTAKGIALKSKTGERSVHMAFPDMKYIGLWHTRGADAPFVCIEPWTSVPGWDRPGIAAFEDKPEMSTLEPQTIYRNTYSLTFG
ncbi:MAG: aldose 1-epimerase family protein [Clostridia bacterium]|nr:aldose 1-epimerase family protein [Clostridia bacterium]